MARKKKQCTSRRTLPWGRLQWAGLILVWHLCLPCAWATMADGANAPVATAVPQDSQLALAGVAVIPHVGTPGVRFRRAPIAPLDTRVQLFLHNRAAGPVSFREILFNAKDAATSVKEGLWSWHDTPDVWEEAQRVMPPDSLVVWSFNSIGKLLSGTLEVDINGGDGPPGRHFDVPIQPPDLWLSAVTFLGPADSPYPEEMIFYVRNETKHVFQIVDCRLFLPRTTETGRVLYANGRLGDKGRSFSEGGRIDPSGLSGARVLTGRLPLTYAAVEVRLRNENGDMRSLWSYLRIKKEAFDISGGWVNKSTPAGPTLTHVPFLKTLRRMHINTAHIADVPGYTDQSGPEGLYERYPLKYFHRLWPVENYDTEAVLARIHAVEFLGEPQYQYGRNGKLAPASVGSVPALCQEPAPHHHNTQ